MGGVYLRMITLSDIISILQLATQVRENAKMSKQYEDEIQRNRNALLIPYIDAIANSLVELCLQIQQAPKLIDNGHAGLAMKNILNATRDASDAIGKSSWRFSPEHENLMTELFHSLKNGEDFLDEFDGEITTESFIGRVLPNCYGDALIGKARSLLDNFREIINY